MNQDYSVCPSYPPAVIVPTIIDDETLKKAAKFRQGGRFPVLCYYHRKNGMVRGFHVRCRLEGAADCFLTEPLRCR